MFPSGNLSLHLFEPRYKLMMQRIVNTTRSFAYVPNLDTYQASVGDVAMRAVLKEVEFLPDGRCLLEARLEGRYKITEHFVEEGTQGLHYCRMEPFCDTMIDCERWRTELQRLVKEGEELCTSLLQGSVKQKIEAYHGLPHYSCPEAFSLWLCGVCLTNNAKKMEMLRSPCTYARLTLGVESLKILLERMSRGQLRCPRSVQAPPPATDDVESAAPTMVTMSTSRDAADEEDDNARMSQS